MKGKFAGEEKNGRVRPLFSFLLPMLSLLTSVVYPSDIIWGSKANMQTGREFHCVAVVNNKLYVIGGERGGVDENRYLDSVEEYDPIADTWTIKTSMSIKRERCAVAVVDNKIYVMGGETVIGGSLAVTDKIEEYDPLTNTWTDKGSMPTKRMSIEAGAVNGKIYVIGGETDQIHHGTDLVEEYDPDTGIWTTKASIPTGRDNVAIAVVNNKVYAIGGNDEGNLNTNIVDEYDPIADTWTTRANMPTVRGFLTAAAINDKIYAIGGANGNSCPQPLNIVEEYDPLTNTWTRKKDMPTPRYFLASGVIGNKVYVVGGRKIIDFNLRTVEEGDIDTIAPSSITGLVASTGQGPGEAVLTWTASGDDGGAGTATKYILKYARTPITNQSNFNNATTYLQTWSPLSSGGGESKTLLNIEGGATYYFAIEAIDNAENVSPISDSASCFVKGTMIDYYSIAVASEVSAGSSFPMTIYAKNESNDTLSTFSGSIAIQTVLANKESLAGGGVLGIVNASLVNGLVVIPNQTYTKAENIRFKISDGNGKTGKSDIVQVKPAAVSKLVLAANPSSIIAGQSSRVSVSVSDVYGNPIADKEISFSTLRGSGTLSSPTSTTDAQGTASVTFGCFIDRPQVNVVHAAVDALSAQVPINVGVLVLANSGGTIAASEDPDTKLIILPGTFASDIQLYIKMLAGLLQQELEKVDEANGSSGGRVIVSATRAFSANKNDGTEYGNFSDYVWVEIPYKDDNDDDIVDGANIRVEELKLLRLNEQNNQWQLVADGGTNTVDRVRKVVRGQVRHFSIYTVGSPLASNLNDVAVYPNPVNFARAVRNTVKIGNITKNATIKIFDVTGRLVKSLNPGTSENDGVSGRAEWNGKNEDGDSVGMGLYFFQITDEAGNKKSGKIGVVK